MRQIVLDTETTGLEVAEGHRIIEIGCVELVNRQPTGRDLHLYINPQRAIDAGAQAVHGITLEFLADKPKFKDIVEDFEAFVADGELIIHNAPFDVGYLDMELGRAGLGKLADHVAGVVDTLAIAKDQFPGKRNSLDALCDRFEVDRSNRVLHGALIDCELLAEVYLCLTRGQDSLLIDFGAGSAADAAILAAFARPQGPLKVLAPTAEELAEHQAYLNELDKSVKGACLWRQLENPLAEVEA